MVNAYPVLGKQKSVDLCRAFVEGALLHDQSANFAVFYGVDDSNMKEWQWTLAGERDWYYIDNSYFDETRGTHFRITKNAVQHSGVGVSTGDRIPAKIRPWRKDGNHIVVCPQSDDFMKRIALYNGDWLRDTEMALRKLTVRPLRVRPWDRNKAALSKTLVDDLRGAWALVTYSSAAAITAICEGVPTISKAGAAACMGSDLATIENPKIHNDRQRFLGVLADNQFTIEEMRRGFAWKWLAR